jgi:anti-sigma B factor antagonist
MSPVPVTAHGLLGRLELTSDAATVTLTGELEAAAADEGRSLLDQAIAAGRPRTVVEMEGVTFIDSTAMRLLLDAHRGAAARGRTLVLRNLRGNPRTMMTLAGLHLTLALEDEVRAEPDDEGEVRAEQPSTA